MAEELVVEVCNLLARRYGFESFTDVRPIDLMQIILADADAIVEWHNSKIV